MTRRFVISDIHGCIKTFKHLLQKIEFSKTDTLVLLGDYIDRGPDSGAVIDYIIELKNSGHKIFPIRGNHEENLLKAMEEYDDETLFFFIKRNKGKSLLNAKNKVKQHYVEFMQNLPYYYQTHDFIFVHAGLNFNVDNPFTDTTSILELRKTKPKPKIIGNKRIVHGHDVRYMDEIWEAVAERKTVIPLDNGCVYTKAHKHYDYTKTGKLCCLNLDTFELILQDNCD